jgi:hypothetical protein
MGVVTLTLAIISIVIYAVLGSVSIAYGKEQISGMTCSDRDFMTIEQWVFGMGIGHLCCCVILIIVTILAFTKGLFLCLTFSFKKNLISQMLYGH